jgi:hypothetical protein
MTLSLVEQYQWIQSRRRFLNHSAMGLGAAVLSSLLAKQASAAVPGLPHFPPRANRVIFLFMGGAPSQIELYDYKPGLEEKYKQPLPDEIRDGQRVTAMTEGKEHLIQPSIFKFTRQGKCGIFLSELLPHLSTVVDELCFIKSMRTEAINHDEGKTQMCTGSQIQGKPSLGAWLSYGLGSLNKNLPDFVVLNSAFWSGDQQNVQALYSRLWGTGFLPSKYQGVAFQAAGDPVLFLSNPNGVSRTSRQKMLELVTQLNNKHGSEIGDPEIQTTIAQQEMAFRMQASVPELTDLGDEPEYVQKLYGPEVHKTGSFARNCLLARRMVERGVRFVQVFHRGWDHHSTLPAKLRGQCKDVDQPWAGLIQDLKLRGMLHDTLIVCTGEFGRTVYCQGKPTATDYGRDHHPRCFTAWLAGGGIKGGIEHGRTDEYSYNIIDQNGQRTTRFEDDAVHVNDLNATILYQLGIDHHSLTFRFQGLDQRLTGVEEAHVVEKILS